MRASIVSNSASGVKPIQRFFALESLQPIELGHHPFGADGINGNHWRREQLLCLSLARLLPSGLCRIHRTSPTVRSQRYPTLTGLA